MNFRWQLFGLAIIALSFDFCASFEVNPLGANRKLRNQLRSLIGEHDFGYDKLLLSTCEKQHSETATLDLSFSIVDWLLPISLDSKQSLYCLNLWNNTRQYRLLNFNCFQKLSNLEYLNLSEINDSLQIVLRGCSHPNIKILILDGLQDVTSYFENKTENFRRINLDFPKLEILSLQNLKRIDNEPNDFSILRFTSTSLTHLFLSDNDIREINDTTLKNFPSTLTHLYLERCRLHSYSAPKDHMKSLTLLSLDGNNFSCANLDCMNIENHPNLQYLSLAKCEIKNISKNTFYYNSKLVYLDLSGNKISHVDPLRFFGTPMLETLNLNDNLIASHKNLPIMPNLRTLYMNKNQMTFFNKIYLRVSNKLKLVSLSSTKNMTIDNANNIKESGKYDSLKVLLPNTKLIFLL